MVGTVCLITCGACRGRQTLDKKTAFDIFLDSFTVVPSRQAISVRRQVGPLPVVHSDYNWKGAQRVTDDFFVHDCSPADVLAAVRAYKPVPLHFLLLVDENPDNLAIYEAAGYRLAYIEYLMARSLDDLPPQSNGYAVRIVQNGDDMARVNAGDIANETWIRPENLQSPHFQHCFIEEDGHILARARNWFYSPEITYVTHVLTHPDYRRRGLARTLMLHLLWDSAAHGAKQSVLVASESGDLLYRNLGYSRLAHLSILQPADQPVDSP